MMSTRAHASGPRACLYAKMPRLLSRSLMSFVNLGKHVILRQAHRPIVVGRTAIYQGRALTVNLLSDLGAVGARLRLPFDPGVPINDDGGTYPAGFQRDLIHEPLRAESPGPYLFYRLWRPESASYRLIWAASSALRSDTDIFLPNTAALLSTGLPSMEEKITLHSNMPRS